MSDAKSQCEKMIQYAPLVGRISMGLIFALAGFGKLADPNGTAGYMTAYGMPYADLLVWPAGLLELGGGILLMIGWQARWAAVALILFTIVATLIFHQFWSVEAAQMQMQQIQFLKNLAIIGGLLYVVTFGSGPGSVTKGSHQA